MPYVTVEPGDCISSLAIEHGLPWELVWDHPTNAELRGLRQNPNILKPGDRVFVPPLEPKQERGPTQQRHVFRIKAVPARLRLRIVDELVPSRTTVPTPPAQAALHVVDGDPIVEPPVVDPKPRADTAFILVIDDGRKHEGRTDADGMIDVPIWPAAREATLVLAPGTPQETVLRVDLGRLDPLRTVEGVKQRLQNLGYPCGAIDVSQGDNYRAALRAYQGANGLPMTGDADDRTVAHLRQRHGA